MLREEKSVCYILVMDDERETGTISLFKNIGIQSVVLC